jgi:hypothetical protein
MTVHHPTMEAIEVADQGHVPLFDQDSVPAITAFIAKCDDAHRRKPGDSGIARRDAVAAPRLTGSPAH